MCAKRQWKDSSVRINPRKMIIRKTGLTFYLYLDLTSFTHYGVRVFLDHTHRSAARTAIEAYIGGGASEPLFFPPSEIFIRHRSTSGKYWTILSYFVYCCQPLLEHFCPVLQFLGCYCACSVELRVICLILYWNL